MPRCTHCGRDLIVWDESCPDCGKPADSWPDEAEQTAQAHETGLGGFVDAADDSAGPMTVIARFRSAAEAGYFAHELMHAGVPVRLTADDSFDALSGYWSTRYMLAVPETTAECAARELKTMIEATEFDDFSSAPAHAPAPAGQEPADETAAPTPAAEEYAAEYGGDAHDRDAAFGWNRDEVYGQADMLDGRRAVVDSGVNWVPIVLTLTVGSMAFWAVRKANDLPLPVGMPPRAGQQHRDLWNTLATDPNPWVQRQGNERGMRELSFDRHTGSAVLREDTNGDGVFDRETLFRR